ncbi:MAG: 2-alkenal reductase [Chloroflexi bacterium]|nr:2-alkenal reductase [Chloroflexota bacterium]
MLPHNPSDHNEAGETPESLSGVASPLSPQSSMQSPDNQPTIQNPTYNPYTSTHKLHAVPQQGVRGGVVASIAALSLVLGGAAGAGAGALIVHNQDSNVAQGATTLSPAPIYQSERVISGDVSGLAVKVVAQVGPAVVSILNNQQPQGGLFGATQTTSAGSGVIIDANGYILTNYHVIDQEQNLKVTFANGTSTTATVVGKDPSNDIAVIKVTTKVPAVAHFGSSSLVRPGESVIAIGNALGNLQNTVTEGIVSGLGRSLPNGNDPTGAALLQNLIQTDAAINHGNSGGPLVDLAGNVIGINTAVIRGTGSSSALSSADQAVGLGFAIPSDTAKAVADRLIFHSPSPFLGVEYRAITPQVSSASGLPVGARILLVTKGSPAEQAGLKQNDVVTAVNGQAINDQHDLKYMLDTYHVGDSVKISVYRNGQNITLTANLGKRPQQ